MKDYMDTEYESNFSITPFSPDNQHSRSTHIETALANRRGSQSIYVGSLSKTEKRHYVKDESSTNFSYFLTIHCVL